MAAFLNFMALWVNLHELSQDKNITGGRFSELLKVYFSLNIDLFNFDIFVLSVNYLLLLKDRMLKYKNCFYSFRFLEYQL